MKNLTWCGLYVALSPTLLAVSLSHAQTQTAPARSLSETVVTAARTPQDPTLLPQGVLVITAEQIQAAGMTHANEAIRWLGGVVGRIDTSGGRDQTLDLRGFGEAASSNVVILVDGVRQNEGDSAGASLSWIPIESIERIEIVRGSGSVMYGEGATAGVINIITQKGLTEPGGSASVALGSHATRDARVSVNTVADAWRLQVHANAFDTDNHRDNYAVQERSALARATWAQGGAQWSFQLGTQTNHTRLPGGITPADFASNPRKTYKPDDHGSSQTHNLLVSGEMPLGDWRMALDLSRRLIQVDSDLVSDDYVSANRTSSKRIGLRSWTEFSWGDARHRFLVGLDSERWQQDKNSNYFDSWAGARAFDATVVDQNSEAAYVRHEVGFSSLGVKLHAGARRTLSTRQASGSTVGTLQANNTSWELGAALRTGQEGEVFGRLGSSFRLANADEFSCYAIYCPAQTVNLLKPQTSRDTELGYRHKLAWGNWSARYYRNDLHDEIGLGSDQFSNMNYDPTRREGLELDVKARLGQALDAGVQLAQRRAVFRSGDHAGKQVPLVPTQSLTAHLTYRMSATQQWLLSSQWVSDQRIAGDLDNTCADRIAGYGTLNLRYSQKVDRWLLSAVVNNLADHRYYNFRSRCDASKKSVYPEAGRTLMVSAQRRF
jgi:iron complex outermembrane receptor protein